MIITRSLVPTLQIPSVQTPSTLSSKESSMRSAIQSIRQFLVSEDGPTAVEYAVMLALILVACITIIQSLGTSISGTFNSVNTALSSGS
jgi:pilus assembly protein Flp/PilA